MRKLLLIITFAVLFVFNATAQISMQQVRFVNVYDSINLKNSNTNISDANGGLQVRSPYLEIDKSFADNQGNPQFLPILYVDEQNLTVQGYYESNGNNTTYTRLQQGEDGSFNLQGAVDFGNGINTNQTFWVGGWGDYSFQTVMGNSNYTNSNTIHQADHNGNFNWYGVNEYYDGSGNTQNQSAQLSSYGDFGLVGTIMPTQYWDAQYSPVNGQTFWVNADGSGGWATVSTPSNDDINTTGFPNGYYTRLTIGSQADIVPITFSNSNLFIEAPPNVNSSGFYDIIVRDQNTGEVQTLGTPVYSSVPVKSVFGRTGNITAQPSDYSSYYPSYSSLNNYVPTSRTISVNGGTPQNLSNNVSLSVPTVSTINSSNSGYYLANNGTSSSWVSSTTAGQLGTGNFNDTSYPTVQYKMMGVRSYEWYSDTLRPNMQMPLIVSRTASPDKPQYLILPGSEFNISMTIINLSSLYPIAVLTNNLVMANGTSVRSIPPGTVYNIWYNANPNSGSNFPLINKWIVLSTN